MLILSSTLIIVKKVKMKTFDLKGNVREGSGKKLAKQIRKQGLVPCEMYGGSENLHFNVDAKAFGKLVYTPDVFLVNLDIDGKKHQGIIQEVQFHPVTDEVLHVDFVEVVEGKEIVVKIPVVIKGNSVGIRNGGKLRLIKRALKVKALAKNLPDTLDIDISKLNIGDTIKVIDLNFEGLNLIDPQSAMVVGVVSSRVSKSMEEGEDEGGEDEGEGEASEEAAASEE